MLGGINFNLQNVLNTIKNQPSPYQAAFQTQMQDVMGIGQNVVGSMNLFGMGNDMQNSCVEFGQGILQTAYANYYGKMEMQANTQQLFTNVQGQIKEQVNTGTETFVKEHQGKLSGNSFTTSDGKESVSWNGSTITVKNNETGKTTVHSGDPHVDMGGDGKQKWMWKGDTLTVALHDGTKVTMNAPKAGSQVDGQGVVNQLDIFTPGGGAHYTVHNQTNQVEKNIANNQAEFDKNLNADKTQADGYTFKIAEGEGYYEWVGIYKELAAGDIKQGGSQAEYMQYDKFVNGPNEAQHNAKMSTLDERIKDGKLTGILDKNYAGVFNKEAMAKDIVTQAFNQSIKLSGIDQEAFLQLFKNSGLTSLLDQSKIEIPGQATAQTQGPTIASQITGF